MLQRLPEHRVIEHLAVVPETHHREIGTQPRPVRERVIDRLDERPDDEDGIQGQWSNQKPHNETVLTMLHDLPVLVSTR
ncbi:hypothetical protein DUI70_0847 [Streptomyces albus]|nr:hypothetical protein DUI70_0847 [Streptomyces albus]